MRFMLETIAFYDIQRAWYSERAARLSAELYLRRKNPGVDANTAAEALADALAVRAANQGEFDL